MPNPFVIKPENLREEVTSDLMGIGPLAPIYNDVVVTPDMVRAMTPAQRNALRQAVAHQRITESVSNALFAALSRLTGWGE